MTDDLIDSLLLHPQAAPYFDWHNDDDLEDASKTLENFATTRFAVVFNGAPFKWSFDFFSFDFVDPNEAKFERSNDYSGTMMVNNPLIRPAVSYIILINNRSEHEKRLWNHHLFFCPWYLHLCLLECKSVHPRVLCWTCCTHSGHQSPISNSWSELCLRASTKTSFQHVWYNLASVINLRHWTSRLQSQHPY